MTLFLFQRVNPRGDTMSELEIGEHVDTENGMMIRRTEEEEYYIRVGGRVEETVVLTEEQIRVLAEVAGFSAIKQSEYDAW